jgi:predicted PurR-regulated permease PerM
VQQAVTPCGSPEPASIVLLGVIGEILVHGVIDLFIGPAVFAIAWELMRAWMNEGRAIETASIEPEG